MRHRKVGRKFGRNSAQRKSLFRNQTTALLKHGQIKTTLAKAKELRRYIEPLITRAKEDTHNNRRQVFSVLQNKHIVTALFEEVAPKSKDRPGGYTRVIRIGFRQGDGAEMAVIELVDFNDIQPEGKTSKKKRTRRAGKSNTPTSAKPAKEEKKEDKTEEVVAEETTEEAEASEEEK